MTTYTKQEMIAAIDADELFPPGAEVEFSADGTPMKFAEFVCANLSVADAAKVLKRYDVSDE